MYADRSIAVSFRNVGVNYRRLRGSRKNPENKYWALRNLSLDIYRGECLGVVGHNGAGKSTLLRVLAGIIRPDTGHVISNGASASLLSLQVGFVNYLSGRENAMLSGMLMGLPKRDVANRMDAISEFSELGDFFDQPVATYSSGMRARLGFSIAIQINPDLLLIDEVLAVGDAHFRQKSASALRTKIQSETTVVLVSHTTNVLENLCERILWIEHGFPRMLGDTREVLDRYEERTPAQPASRERN
jgi:lipopolysaccharide transport system ATP-binding protein